MVVLNGRSTPSAEVATAIAEMNAAGSRVEVITGDIAEPGTAVRLVAAVEDAGLRPAGVLHSATVLADEIALNMSRPAAARVFAPKVAGSWWLHQDRPPGIGLVADILLGRFGFSAHPGRAPTRPRTRGSMAWSPTGGRWVCPRSGSTGVHGPRWGGRSSPPISASR